MAQIDKNKLRSKILELEGLDNELKSQLLQLLSEQKRYGLVWENKPEEAEDVLRENIPVLKEVEVCALPEAIMQVYNKILSIRMEDVRI